MNRPAARSDRTVAVDDALQEILARVHPMPPERVPVEQSVGRRLADPVVAPFALWPFARAAMDGFAVRSADVAGARPEAPVELQVNGQLYPGQPPTRLAPGQAIRIMTGAVVPEGADAVIPLEQVEEVHEGSGRILIRVRRAVPTGKNVFPPAEDARAGQVVLAPGELVTPSGVGLLAALGMREVRVHRRPRAAVLAVGDELISPDGAESGPAGRSLPPGRLFDSNSPALASALESHGAEVQRLGTVPDDLPALLARIAQATSYDLLVLTGGVSVGDKDLTVDALQRAGADVVFTRLLVKPGKAVAFATLGSTLVFALPGSPGAAMTAFLLLVVPAVRAMGGTPRSQCLHPRLMARLMRGLEVSPGRPHYLWGRLAFGRGVAAVWPIGPNSTAVVRSQALANALIEVPPEFGRLEAGTGVEVLWFDPRAPVFEEVPVPVVGVVGPHNSGKTTLLEALIPELARRGLRAAALKHDVHGFELDHEGKDTWRLSRAGAAAVAIAGVGRTGILLHHREMAPDALAAAVGEGVDLVLVEGFRRARVPKIEIVPAGESPLVSDGERLAVVRRENGPDGPGWVDARDVAALASAIESWVAQWHRRLAVAAGIEP